MKDVIMDLSTLISKLKDKSPFKYNFRANSEEFWVSESSNETYVEPDFSIISEISNCNLEEAQVILISAVGATGKSELTRRLSYSLKIPVVDLGQTKVVGGNSLTGLIFQHLKPLEGGQWLEDIQNGKTCMIIDALDEGYQKTNTQGFFDFLDDVVKKISKDDCSFIMLGRTNAIELASLYLDGQGIKVAVLQIEPFSLEKAKEFIDKQVCKTNTLSAQHEVSYKATRDYVLDSLGDFFKAKGKQDEEQGNKFIGYAPVLLAISEFLNSQKVGNYKMLFENLKKSKVKSISLILDIMHRILERDKTYKVVPNLIMGIVKNRSAEFKKVALRDAYTEEEQCARVLYILLGEDYPFKPVDDEAFDIEYRKGLVTWMPDHPFLKGRKPANVVFECYILAKLIGNNKYKDAVYRYLNKTQISSFMFFYLFKELNKKQNIDAEIIPYLFNSLKMLDNKSYYYSLEIEASNDNEEDPLSYDVTFVCSDNSLDDYEFKTVILDQLVWFGTISDINVDISQDFVMGSQRTDMFAPSYIHCENLVVHSNEINYSCRDLSKSIVIEAKSISTKTPSGVMTKIQGIGCPSGKFTILTPNSIGYPYCDYRKNANDEELKMSAVMTEIYQKMRRALIMFRSHSKGQLAKSHAKIDNRIGSTPLGKNVIKALVNNHIIYRDEHVYVIDNVAMDKFLGVKFDGIRNSTITNTMLKFLSDIEKCM